MTAFDLLPGMSRPILRRMRLVWRLAATVLVTAVVMHWWPLLVFAAAVGIAFWCADCGDRLSQKQWQRETELTRRADQQHHWVLQGDERGVYGFTPPDLRVSCSHR